ncbi:MAG: DNA-processing protein DprA [Spirochaetes bacterium]|nr:DNA-processing protein DprA [Spirochaetota bacterium]
MNDTKLWMALSRIEGIGIASLKKIHSLLASLQLSLYDIFELEPKAIAHETGLSLELSQYIAKIPRAIDKTEKEYEDLIEKNIEPVLFFDSRYPEKILKNIDYPPPILYFFGNSDIIKTITIALLSDHNASERGYHIAYHAASIAARHSITVVSGFAKGPQIMAHRGAVEAGGNTIVVIPMGMDNLIIPDILKDSINLSQWLFISPFVPQEEYALHNSYKRNSMIAAMVNALIIIETANNAGCFEAAKSAKKYKTPLFVVEYAKYPDSAIGNPVLIKDYQATPLRGRIQNDVLVPNMDACIAKARYGDSN